MTNLRPRKSWPAPPMPQERRHAHHSHRPRLTEMSAPIGILGAAHSASQPTLSCFAGSSLVLRLRMSRERSARFGVLPTEAIGAPLECYQDKWRHWHPSYRTPKWVQEISRMGYADGRRPRIFRAGRSLAVPVAASIEDAHRIGRHWQTVLPPPSAAADTIRT